ncbi:MAG TPA: redoxin family protein [Candidatus Koribacter sp.]|jgi:thiol-disulfide isomerase/thioredoxin
MKTAIRAIFSLLVLSAALSAVEPALTPEAKAAYERAHNEYGQAKFKDAAHDYGESVRMAPNCQLCLQGLALSNAQLGFEKESLKTADKALALAVDPMDKVAAHNCKGEICLMYSSADPKKLLAAENEFRTSLSLVPASANTEFRLGYTLLREKKDDEGKQQLQAFLNANPGAPETEMAKRLIANPRRARELYAPDFAFTTAQGETINNASLEGKVVVLDFWATWCGPCRESLPEIKELTKKYGDRLRVISVSADNDAKAWRDFIADKHMDWGQYLDSDDKIQHAFNVHAYPTYIVMNREGIVVKRMEGIDPQESLIHRLRDELKKILD